MTRESRAKVDCLAKLVDQPAPTIAVPGEAIPIRTRVHGTIPSSTPRHPARLGIPCAETQGPGSRQLSGVRGFSQAPTTVLAKEHDESR
jgi:hypothetical protein